jgi:integrating conjugative element protein (TIGR03749 family)
MNFSMMLSQCFRIIVFAGVLVSAFLFNPAFAEPTSSIETLVWNRAPLRLSLPVNQERRVDFPGEVVAYIPDAIADKLKLTATLEGSLFWRATEAFKAERMIVTDKSGRVQWLLDVSADLRAPKHTLVIRDSRVQESDNSLHQVGHVQTESPMSVLDATDMLDEVGLIQVAARQFYGPSRLAALPPGVSGSMVSEEAIDIYRGGGLSTVIKGQWRASSWDGDLYVTAVMVSNQSNLESRPDPRRVNGRLIAIAMQHAWLAPAGQYPHDTTVWYLVSERPLQEAMTP